MYGQKEIVRLLLSQEDVLVNGVDNDGETALMVAATVGHKSIVDMLLQRTADVNRQDDDGSTALIYASLYGHNEIVRTLLSQGAQVNLHNRYVYCPPPKISSLLLPLPTFFSFSSRKGLTPLFAASQNGHAEAVKVLLEDGADVNKQNKYGTTSLFLAAQIGNREIVEALLSFGADVNIINHKRNAPIFPASEHGFVDIVEMLIRHGAELNQPNHAYFMRTFHLRDCQPEEALTEALSETIASEGHVELFRSLLASEKVSVFFSF